MLYNEENWRNKNERQSKTVSPLFRTLQRSFHGPETLTSCLPFASRHPCFHPTRLLFPCYHLNAVLELPIKPAVKGGNHNKRKSKTALMPSKGRVTRLTSSPRVSTSMEVCAPGLVGAPKNGCSKNPNSLRIAPGLQRRERRCIERPIRADRLREATMGQPPPVTYGGRPAIKAAYSPGRFRSAVPLLQYRRSTLR